jgi:hypothetical protein
MVAATAKQTFGRRAESTAVGGFLPFEEIAVDDGFAQITVVRGGAKIKQTVRKRPADVDGCRKPAREGPF